MTARSKAQIGIVALATLLLLIGIMVCSAREPVQAVFQSPLPTPTSLPTPPPTVPPDLPNNQRAILFISQREGVPEAHLKSVDSVTITFPLTGVTLWKGLVLDVEDRLHTLYEVFIHEGTKEILNGTLIDPLSYWGEEEKAFRKEYREQIASAANAREDVPVDQLEIVPGLLAQYPLGSGPWVWQGKVEDAVNGQSYWIAVTDQGQEIDVLALERLKAEAKHAKYGKLDLKLFYLLPLSEPGERVKVLLWIGGVDHSWVDEELARRYPHVGADYFASGQPFTDQGRPVAVAKELSGRIRDDYNDLLDQAHREAAEPVAAFLTQRECEFVVLDAFPGIAAELAAHEIQALDKASLDNLSTIYYGEFEIVPQIDDATGTIRADPVWEMGYNGDFSGLQTPLGDPIRLGIMDISTVGYPYDLHPAFSGKVILEPIPERHWDHAAWVAGIMLGNDTRPDYVKYRGVAWGSQTLVTAKTDVTWEDMNWKLNLLVDNKAWIINVSLGTEGSRWMQPEDRAFDYVVRYRDPTIVVSAGNHMQCSADWNICSPGKGHNVITVGGIKDNNNPQWYDDGMWERSCYRDPYYDDGTGVSTFSKPDVVAVGYEVNVIDVPQVGTYTYRPVTGTSYAAPQVAGLAALLVQRYSPLSINPEAIKAIIMASAIHDIENDGWLGEKDGAGAINAAAVMDVFDRGGWAHHIIHDIYDQNDPSNLFRSSYTYNVTGSDPIWDVGSTFAQVGERVRAALCWNSNPSSSFASGGSNLLATNLDLKVLAPGGQEVGNSSDYFSSCELVDFTATKSGVYTMRLSRQDYGGESANLGLGLAWLRVRPQYLPDVKGSYDGWNSVIVIQNRSATSKKVTITYLDSDGQYTDSMSTTVNHRATWTHSPDEWPTYLNNFAGSAIVDGSEDVSVVVETRKSSTGATAAYPGLRPSQAATRLGLPLIFHNVPSAGHYWDTEIIVHNPNANPAGVTVRFYPGGHAPWQPIPANGTGTFKHNTDGFFGSAVLSSDRPVVAVVREYATDQVMASAYPALSPSTAPIQLPLLFKQIYSQGEYWNTSFHVQNLGDSSTDLTITYVCEFSQNPGGCSGGNTCVKHAWALGPNEAFGFDQRYHLDGCGWDTFFGSAKVESSSEPIAVAVNQRPLNGSGLTNRLGTYVGVGVSAVVQMPRLQKDAGGWSTSVAVRNAGTQDATTYLHYYSGPGTVVGNPHPETIEIEAEGIANIDQRYDWTLGVNPLDGSGVLVSDQPVVVVVNRRHDPPGDNLCSYNGLAP